jgi:hypothetical protein
MSKQIKELKPENSVDFKTVFAILCLIAAGGLYEKSVTIPKNEKDLIEVVYRGEENYKVYRSGDKLSFKDWFFYGALDRYKLNTKLDQMSIKLVAKTKDDKTISTKGKLEIGISKDNPINYIRRSRGYISEVDLKIADIFLRNNRLETTYKQIINSYSAEYIQKNWSIIQKKMLYQSDKDLERYGFNLEKISLDNPKIEN